MPKPIYIPIVKGKKNDLRSLGELESDVRSLIKPLIELPPVPSTKDVDSYLQKFIDDLTRFGGDGAMFVDFYGFMPGDTTIDATPATIAGYNLILDARLPVTPVYGLGRDNTMWGRMQEVVSRHKQGFCFRLEEDDLEEDAAEATWDALLTRSAQLGLGMKSVDLVIDLRDVRLKSVAEKVELVTDFMSYQPANASFRTIAVSGSSAPRDMSVLPQDSIGLIPRNELKIWASLRADLIVGNELIYSDYGVVHPDFAADNMPVGGTANCKIRYTVGKNIMIVRGHKRKGDSGQPHVLADKLRQHPKFCHPEFSFGDRYISDVADFKSGPGNLGNWVLADMNHHVTFVTLQMERLLEKLQAELSPDEIESLLDA